MKQRKEHDMPNSKTIFRRIIFAIVSGLYGTSIVFVGVGFVVLLIILFLGDINIKNAQLFALGILLYLPLRYLKRRLEQLNYK